MKQVFRTVLILQALMLAACTHPLVITPDMSSMDIDSVTRIHKNAGYYIAASDKRQVSLGPSSMGESVSYMPYRDLEPAIKSTLANIFDRVSAVPSLNDEKFLRENNISYIFVPRIVRTDMTNRWHQWSPDTFTISLECIVYDQDRHEIWKMATERTGHDRDNPQDEASAPKMALLRVMQVLQDEINEKSVFRASRQAAQ